MKLDYTKGSIWWTNLPRPERSSVESGYRPVVILSSTFGCLSSDVVTVAPITTRIKDLSVNIRVHSIDGYRDNQVLTNQLVTVPKNSLTKPSGYLDSQELSRVEQGVLVSLGIAKPVVDNFKANQEALLSAKKDREELEKLIPQSKEIISKLTELVSRVENKKVKQNQTGYTRVKRSKEEILSFVSEWEDPYNKKSEVVKAFGFNHYNTAWNFYKSAKKKIMEGKL